MSIWTRLHRLVTRAALARCRHPDGTVCIHRYYEYDEWNRGYVAGFHAGENHERRDWETASPELLDSWLHRHVGRGDLRQPVGESGEPKE
jgi:hypothetical protein